MDEQTPVSSWTTDWDHTDEAWSNNPFAIWDELRTTCPVARTERFGGAWLPTRHEDISAIAYDTDRFTSRFVVVGNNRIPTEAAPAGPIPPITSDPPYHHGARRKLLPAFSPKAVAELEPETRAFCHRLLDEVEGLEVVDAAAAYAQHIPVHVIAQMLGFPESDADKFRHFIHTFLENVTIPFDERFDEIMGLFGYLQEQIDDHVANPRDDLTQYLIALEEDPTTLLDALKEIEHELELEGELVDDRGAEPGEEVGDFEPLLPPVLGTMALLLVAGIDTTWSAIGASIWHLAGHPEHRQRLVDEPEILPTAMEELLRAYAPVTMARLVREDMEWNGCPMKADDWMILPFPAANRDPEVFDRPDEVDFDRPDNRHAAFGLGIHRCVGSNLARMEMRVALEVWLERFPEFTLDDPDAVTWSHGQVRGPRHLPIRVKG